MARLTIELDDADADAPDTGGRGTRRRSIGLRLDGKAWMRVEPEAFAELRIAAGDEIDEPRRAAVEEALARVRARLFVIRSLSVKMQSVAELEQKLAADWGDVDLLASHKAAREDLEALLKRWEALFAESGSTTP